MSSAALCPMQACYAKRAAEYNFPTAAERHAPITGVGASAVWKTWPHDRAFE